MANRDCLGFDRHSKMCFILDKTYCNKEDCKFYKNQRIVDEQTEKIRQRIPNYDPQKRRSDWYKEEDLC